MKRRIMSVISGGGSVGRIYRNGTIMKISNEIWAICQRKIVANEEWGRIEEMNNGEWRINENNENNNINGNINEEENFSMSGR